MTRIRVNCFSLSLDGFGAGPDQSLDHPLGVGGEQLHEWFYGTRTFQAMLGNEGGADGIDEDYAAAGIENLGAWILGRNMFGPIRGDWPDEEWKGWWGTSPPYHAPVFVLTHHPRAPIEMEGGTTFHFVTEGIHAALDRAVAAAGGKDVRIGGGAATIRQYLEASLIDEMHLAIGPVLLGSGEPLLQGLDLPALGYEVAGHQTSEHALHVTMRQDPGGLAQREHATAPPGPDSLQSERLFESEVADAWFSRGGKYGPCETSRFPAVLRAAGQCADLAVAHRGGCGTATGPGSRPASRHRHCGEEAGVRRRLQDLPLGRGRRRGEEGAQALRL